MKCKIWYLDGTFKVVPSIFFQLFVIMGSCVQTVKGEEQTVALPFVFALMNNKAEASYTNIFQVMRMRCESLNFPIIVPSLIMTDFEIAIINAAKTIDESNVRACFFHLCQSVFRHIQHEGLQAAYGNLEEGIKEASQKMCALAFVPVDTVEETFDLLYDEVADYFEVI